MRLHYPEGYDLEQIFESIVQQAERRITNGDFIESGTSTSSRAPSPAPDPSDEAPTHAEQPIPEEAKNDFDFGLPLKEGQRRVVTSQLYDPIEITFDQEEERMRAQSSLLPPCFFRTFYETSATLSKYVSIDTHTKHRTKKELKIRDGIAFQPISDFEIHTFLTKDNIERHLVWNQKKNPSAFISVFNFLEHATRRAGFHYDESQRIGQRVSIAKISNAGLIPATVRARCKSKIQILFKEKGFQEVPVKFTFVWTNVAIPVWIEKKAKTRFGATIKPEHLKASGAMMWTSITEIRKSNLKEQAPKASMGRDSICAKGHDYEWLCCGSIPDSNILGVFPWDGKQLHFQDPGYPIRSFENSGQPWVWNWSEKMWLPDYHGILSITTQTNSTGHKRKRGNDDASGTQLHKRLSLSAITSVETLPLLPASRLSCRWA